jgi:hypothetical protein
MNAPDLCTRHVFHIFLICRVGPIRGQKLRFSHVFLKRKFSNISQYETLYYRRNLYR